MGIVTGGRDTLDAATRRTPTSPRALGVRGRGGLLLAVLLGCAPALAGPGPRGGGALPSEPLAPEQLSHATRGRFADWIRVRPGEQVHRSIPWRSTVAEAMRDAQRLDRPLLLWLYFGGPLGAC